MDRLSFTATDLQKTRFGYSPLVELAESLHLILSGRIPTFHRAWYDAVIAGVRQKVDLDVAKLVVPVSRRHLAGFFLTGLHDANPSFEAHLSTLQARHPEEIRRDLCALWTQGVPAGGEELLRTGTRQLCVMLSDYWEVALAPFWPRIKGTLEDDIAHRASGLLAVGLEGVLRDLSSDVALTSDAIEVSCGMDGQRDVRELDLAGRGLRLVPCVFAWPHPIVGSSTDRATCILYGARGSATLWERINTLEASPESAVEALLGRNRAAILWSLTTPRSTTELARELGQSPPGVNVHLAILRRSGLVSSRRLGRRVLYRATPLAERLLAINGGRR